MRAAQAHYERLADDYENNWAYSPEFIGAMAAAIGSALSPRPDDTLVDLGGGTGLFSRELIAQKHLTGPIYCVDPSQAMLDQIQPGRGLIPIKASAEQLANGTVEGMPDAVDAILIKEAVHHFEDPGTVLKCLAGMLRPEGRILVVMLPVEISYPLFDAALRRFSELQPDPAEIAEAMRAAGLHTVRTGYEYPLTFAKSRYLDMVRQRYMSLLSTFSDAEISDGIDEIEQRYADQDVLRFVDRFEFIIGRRSN
jgi:SAM-dependent methyltransferase